MGTHGRMTFKIESWDEKPFVESPGGGKLTRASVQKSFEGDLEGRSTLEYLMAYTLDGSASFVGFEHVVGRLAGRSGSFVLQHQGRFEGGMAKADYFVVPGSGTDELRGLRGEGRFAAGHQERYPMELDYSFV